MYDEEKDVYRLALYLDGDEYALFETDDLVHFRLKQTVHLPEDNECPDLFPLTADDDTRHWVLIGAHDRYLVGRFDADGQFRAQSGRAAAHLWRPELRRAELFRHSRPRAALFVEPRRAA